ncbi:mCG140424, isoform CRA_b, partial [Mus musculus]
VLRIGTNGAQTWGSRYRPLPDGVHFPEKVTTTSYKVALRSALTSHERKSSSMSLHFSIL